jgi:small-conductance mechanosensitive channel
MVPLTDWPVVDRLLWTAGTLAATVLLGYLINAFVIRSLHRLAGRNGGEWDDAVIVELRRRIPLWSALAGLWISVAYWPLNDQWRSFATGAIVIVGVLSVTLSISAIAVRLTATYLPRVNPDVQVSGILRNAIRIVVFVVGTLVILGQAGIHITPVLAALGVGGLAVALALQDPLSNLFSGLFVTLAGQMRIGDRVRMEGGPEGYVTDFTWRSTTLRTLPGHIVVVPNAKLAQAIVTILDRPTPEAGFGVDFTVGAGSDLDVVERTATAVAASVMKNVTGGVPTAEVAVRFHAFTDLGVQCSVGLRSQRLEDQALIRHELIKRLKPALEAAGIEIPTVAHVSRPRPGS